MWCHWCNHFLTPLDLSGLLEPLPAHSVVFDLEADPMSYLAQRLHLRISSLMPSPDLFLLTFVEDHTVPGLFRWHMV